MNQSPSKPLVAFDFDGVLVDTYQVTYEVSQRMEGTKNHEQFRQYYEQSVFKTIVKQAEAINPEHANQFTAAVTEQTWKQPPVDGIADVVHMLAENHELVIVTSNVTETVLRWLSLNGLEHRFSAILGGDVERSKSVKLKSLAHETGLHVFITDTLGDILEANVAGLPTIGVTWGFHERWRLEKGNPAAIIDSPWDVITAVNAVLSKQSQ